MHSSSLQFLIEVTFNLTLVDDSAWPVGGSWKNYDILQLILSACQWSPMMSSRLSIQSFSPAETAEIKITESLPTPTLTITPAPTLKRALSIVRGRDLPFPAVPIQRRRSLQVPSSTNSRISVLLQQRYSSMVLPPALATDEAAPSRGRTLQRTTRPARPTLARSDSCTLSHESLLEEVLPAISSRMSRNSSLLREPPFPLPHRVLQRPASSSSSPSSSPRRMQEQRKESKPGWKRVSSIPPPLQLEEYEWWLDVDEDEEDSPVLGREETKRLLEQRRVSLVQARRCSVSRGPQHM
ncbi:hypothetical protein LshimejAT787_1202660 [Lyophyllum shimeji]|uniref:Uncharacterized protein n=1 Tax=Lyophyllum shimeji TaxID=47721 RepID=A0A9P3PTY6_LYOSH|nr:hypothetical protein LshimejAT787_1202660 [Lyophyllum shimeji]